MIALLAHPLARLAIACALAAAVGAGCAASHYRLRIEAIELRHQSAIDDAKAKAAQLVADNLKRNQELTHEYQTTVDGLRDRYAAARVRVKASASAVPQADATAGTDGSADSNRLSVGMGTLELLEQCDLNTQKLMGLQAWAGLAEKP